MVIDPLEFPVNDLYDVVKDSVWVLKFEGTIKGEPWSTSQTAFAVDADQGLLMSCAHGEWPLWSNLQIKARPTFNAIGFRYDADVVLFKPECDVSMFKLRNTRISSVVNFGSGKVKVGDPIFLLGHQADYIGSGTLGRAAYPCLENGPVDFEGQLTCENYRCRVKSKTPSKRIMGHVWNKSVFNNNADNKTNNFEFEKNLLSSIPVVQGYGLVGGGGASGAPLFNSAGELIGMLVCGADGFEIGIHVSVLQQLLQVVVRYLLEVETSKKKAGVTRKKKAGETSKKKAGETSKKKTGESSKVKAGETSKKKAGETSKDKADESSKEKAGESSKKRAGETSKEKAGQSSKVKAGESSKVKDGESSKKRADESSKKRAGKTSKDKASESSKRKAGESSKKRAETGENKKRRLK